MTDREIRAMLRGATKAKVLDGWYWVGVRSAREYIVAPPRPASTVRYSGDEAVAYCWMLRAAGVEPLYRESEPAILP